METIENTVVKRVGIIIEDHGILTIHVQFEQGSLPLRMMHGPDAPALGKHCRQLLEVFGKYDLSDIEGQPARVKRDGGSWTAIGHFMEDRWYTGRNGNGREN